MLCGAKTRFGGQCQKPPPQGRPRCSLHGGMSLAGQCHPNYRHGRRSKEYIQKAREARERLRELIYLGRMLGMFIE
jgi:glucans biosynthesis protein